jgi:hypothetical protein
MMGETKSFEDLAREQGGTVEPWIPSEEFMRDFSAYMEESIRQSRINMAKALDSARHIFIF